MTKKESTKAYRISWADEYFETPSLLPGEGGGGVLLGILDGVPPGAPNRDPISDQKM